MSTSIARYPTCRAKGGVASCTDPHCPEKKGQAADREQFISSALKNHTKPDPASNEAWDGLKTDKTFQHNLQIAAMRGYRSYDVSTIEEGVEEAGGELYTKYHQQRNTNPDAERTLATIRAHQTELRSELTKMVTSYFRTGSLPADR
jgi:hypothetical protein